MDLIINFKDLGKIGLELKQGRVSIDTLDFSFQGNLDDVLITSVDKFLKKNRINALSLKTVRVDGRVDQNSSAYKIALTFIKAWKEAKNL